MFTFNIERRVFSTRAVLACVVLLVLCIAPGLPVYADDSNRTVLITGSNRGIGLEFVRQYAKRGWRVIATCRTPATAAALNQLAEANPRISVEELDVTDEEDINALRKKYADQPIELLINNAALLGPRSEQGFGSLNYGLATSQFAVNALAPLRVSAAFIDNVRAAGPGKIITLGSAAGSNGYLRPPADFYSYRASKAAVHFLMHNLALELAPEDIVVGLLNPGLVDTRGLADIGPNDPVPEDFRQIVALIRNGAIELSTAEESVAAMIPLIDSLTLEQSGVFLNFDGQVIPW
jgi:NAD(P)-dependent dehydrogenase (short-subunit alcohol dehydrogenase family)